MSKTNKGIENIKIWCETNEILDSVLKKLDKEGFRWFSGHKASKWKPLCVKQLGLYINTEKLIGFTASRSYFYEHYYVEISANDFLANESIVIYRKGQEVIALDKTTGKKAVAKCCPDDEFDFNTGAKLAFERLLGIEQPKEDDGFCHKFKDGKTYVFRKSLHDKRFSSSSSWSSECDGKVVTVENHEVGVICGFRISPEWCEEIDLAIGDMVKVVYTGDNYSTFDTWKGLKGYEQNYVRGSSPRYKKEYKVLNIKEHGGEFDDGHILALIQDLDTTQVFIIRTTGIKKA